MGVAVAIGSLEVMKPAELPRDSTPVSQLLCTAMSSPGKAELGWVGSRGAGQPLPACDSRAVAGLENLVLDPGGREIEENSDIGSAIQGPGTPEFPQACVRILETAMGQGDSETAVGSLESYFICSSTH